MNLPPQDWILIVLLTLSFIFIIGTFIYIINGEIEYRELEKLTEQNSSKEKP